MIAANAQRATSGSTIDLLGEIPAGWEAKPLKHLTPIDRQIMYGIVLPGPNVEHGVPIVKSGDCRTENLRLDRLHRTTHEIESKYVRSRLRPGDLVFAIRGSVGMIATVPHELAGANLTQDAARIAPRNGIHGGWLSHAVQSYPVQAQIGRDTLGATIRGINIRDLKRVVLPVPSWEQQQAIADFLDQKTAAIDALIEKKERLIALLEEKRQALITQAVTKGLDPTVPMKDSGVEWLGEVPAHWDVKRLMHLTALSRPIMYGIVLPGPNVEEGVPIVKSGDCRPGRLKLHNLHRTTHEIERGYARARLKPGDVVYAIRGSVGMTAIVPDELAGANMTQDAARISPMDGVDSTWLCYALQSTPAWRQLERLVIGATVRGINIRDLERPWLPVPPYQEQLQLAKHLEESCFLIERLQRGARRSVGLLREYRQALITAAVTGKIDVTKEAVS